MNQIKFARALRAALPVVLCVMLWTLAPAAARASDAADVLVAETIVKTAGGLRTKVVKRSDGSFVSGRIQNKTGEKQNAEYWWTRSDGCSTKTFPDTPRQIKLEGNATANVSIALPDSACNGIHTLTLYVKWNDQTVNDRYRYSFFVNGTVAAGNVRALNHLGNQTQVLFKNSAAKVQAFIANSTGGTQFAKVTLWAGGTRLVNDLYEIPPAGKTFLLALSTDTLGSKTLALDVQFYGPNTRQEKTYRIVTPLQPSLWVTTGSTLTHSVKAGTPVRWGWQVKNPNPTNEPVTILFDKPNFATCGNATREKTEIVIGAGGTLRHDDSPVPARCANRTFTLQVTVKWFENVQYTETWKLEVTK